MAILTIDTDSKGAVCVVDYDKPSVDIRKIPRIVSFDKEVVDGVALYVILTDLFALYNVDQIVIERQHARTGQGVSSMFSFGRTYGTIITALRLAMGPNDTIEYVTGGVWKKRMGLSASKADMKDKALDILKGMGLDIPKFTIPMADAFMLNIYARKWGTQKDGQDQKAKVAARTA